MGVVLYRDLVQLILSLYYYVSFIGVDRYFMPLLQIMSQISMMFKIIVNRDIFPRTIISLILTMVRKLLFIMYW